MLSTAKCRVSLVLALVVMMGACTEHKPGDASSGPLGTSRQELTSLGPVLLRDINTSTRPADVAEPTVLGEQVFFSADDGVTGRELYVTDGTAAGTRRVKDILPGAGGSHPQQLTVFEGRLYFFARLQDSIYGPWTLWRSDGTEAGTLPLTTPQQLQLNEVPERLVASRGALFFLALRSPVELWRSDGTPEGTARVKQFEPAIFRPGDLTDAGGTLFFLSFRQSPGLFDRELWKSDGTDAGTVRLKRGFQGALARAGAVGNGVVFVINGDTSEMWNSDGTEAGTVRIHTFVPRSQVSLTYPSSSAVMGSRLYFVTYTPGVGEELWASDGTAAGTGPIKTLHTGNTATGTAFSTVGGRLYFNVGDDVHGRELWTSDGTAAGTGRLTDLNPGAGSSNPSTVVGMGGRLYFSAEDGLRGRELWRTDGVSTELVQDLFPGGFDATPEQLVVTASGRTLLFVATDGVHGRELWRTDGTAAGTALTRDVAPRPEGSGVTGFTRMGARSYFSADDGRFGRELWTTDGTAEGTRLVKDIRAGTPGANPRHFTEVGGALFFVTTGTEGRAQIWKTDGTSEGTARVDPGLDISGGEESIHGLANLQGALVFMTEGARIWKTDGTPGGTVLLKETHPRRFGASFSPPALINGVLYYGAFGASQGSDSWRHQLWRTDGTAGGTFLVKDLGPDSEYNLPTHLMNVNGSLFFVAGNVLWKSDGTEAGTVSGVSLGSFYSLIPMEGSLFFVKSVEQGHFELWKTDGTPGGTVSLLPLATTEQEALGAELTVVGRTLFFVATGPHGRELWKSDGTPQGTQEVKDIRPAPAVAGEAEPGSAPTALAAINGVLYFSVNDAIRGEEPWQSDGTAAGTRRLSDLVPGALGSRPRFFTAQPEGVLVMAEDERTGFEPRLLVPVSVTCPDSLQQEATSAAGTSISYPPAIAADGVSASTPIQYSHPAGRTFPLGSTQIQVTVDEPAFRFRSCSFTVTVVDTTPPRLQCPPAQRVETTDPAGAVVDFPPVTVEDSVSTPALSYNYPSGSLFPRDTPRVVTVTATDAAGNTATCSFGVTVTAPPPELEPEGCGCGTAAPVAAWWLMMILIPVARRRGWGA